ncbi:MAG: TIR domain-containing protein [Bacillota bacterium]|nr:TIR domain-containing protein [Bacillota bacterium]
MEPEPAVSGGSRKKYAAFISYRHVEPDASIAARIHGQIERFRPPAELRPPGAATNARVFRDREELTARDLSDSLLAALNDSEFLIVICSRRLPLSPWCLQEVETFLTLNGPDRIIPVLLEGEPAESFPPALLNLRRETVLPDGGRITEPLELLAADLRPEAVRSPDFPGYAALEESHDPRLAKLRHAALRRLGTEKYRILATMLGVTYGDLRQRDKIRRSRRLTAATALALMVMLVFGIVLFRAYTRAEEARRRAVEQNSALLMSRALDHLADGDSGRAVLVGDRAMAQLETGMESYQDLSARYGYILNNSLHSDGLASETRINTENSFSFSCLSPDGRYVASGYGASEVGIWELASGRLETTLTGFRAQVKLVQFSPSGRLLAAGGLDNQVLVWSAEGREKARFEVPGILQLLAFSPAEDGLLYAYAGNDGNYIVFHSLDGTTPARKLSIPVSTARILFHPRNDTVFVLYDDYMQDLSLSAYDWRKAVELHDFPAPSGADDSDGADELFLPAEPWRRLALSSDGSLLYAAGQDQVSCFATDSFEELYTISCPGIEDMALSGDGGLLHVTTAPDEASYRPPLLQTFVVRKGAAHESAAREGDCLRQLQLPARAVRLETDHADGVYLLLADGTLQAFHGTLRSAAVPGGPGMAIDSMEIAADDGHLLLLSRKDQSLRIIRIGRKNMGEEITGQLLATSQNRRYALLYREGAYVVWDSAASREHWTCRPGETAAGTSDIYCDTRYRYAVSGDGAAFATIDSGSSESGGILDFVHRFRVCSSSGEQIHYEEFAIDQEAPFIEFTTAGDALFVQWSDGHASRLPLDPAGSEQMYTDLAPSLARSLRETADGRYFCLNLSNGNYHIYERSNGREVMSGSGTVLYLEEVDGALGCQGIYLDRSFRVNAGRREDGVELSHIHQTSGSFFDDVDSLDPEHDLFLRIRKGADGYTALLYRFSTGDLLQRIMIDLEAYQAKGYIRPDGRELVVSRPNTLYRDGADGSPGSYNSLARYLILSQEELAEEAARFSAGRRLTDDEWQGENDD